jgi:predicted phosphate transport protein (TIGR00153 family)
MTSRFFSWFTPKRDVHVLGMVKEHLNLTQEAVNDLFRLVEASSLKREEKTKQLFERLSKLEMRADQLRRNMVEELTKSEMLPEEREDLMELVRAVDWIADWSKEAGRILVIIPFEKAPEEMKTAAQNMCKTNVRCVSVLSQCIETLPENPMEAINLTNEVELLEEDIDEIYSVARAQLVKMNADGFSSGSLILLNMFLDALETVADWCENTADIVRAVAVRSS